MGERINSWFTCTAEETMNLANLLLPEILNKKVVLLSGSLGSGKTTFVKGLAKTLGIKKTVTSPTYTYLHIYPSKNGQRLYHFDFYRLHANHFPELEEAMEDSRNIVVVEWPEKIERLSIEEAAMILQFEKQEEGHQITKCDKL